MFSLLRRTNALVMTLLIVFGMVAVPILGYRIVHAAPTPAADFPDNCPANIRDPDGACTCPEGMTALDCEALAGSWQNWVPDDAFCGTNSSGSVTVTPGENKRAAFIYFVQRGLTPNQSAGMVGNLEAESGLDPTIQERNPIAGRGGFGIAQWTGSRRVAIESFAASTGADLNSLQFQLDYLWNEELSKGYKSSVLDPIKATTTIRQASDIFLHKFESPLDQSTSVEIYRASLGQKIFELYGGEVDGATNPLATSGGCSSGTSAFVGFPLQTTKERMAQLNSGCFLDSTQVMCDAGHPYAAHDIFADPGTTIVSILDGKIIGTFEDKCGGKSISVYSEAEDVTVSYLHMGAYKITSGPVTAGQVLGTVGSSDAACGTSPHLHIDAALGQPRPGCTREDCPAANAAIFQQGSDKIDLDGGLYDGYKKLP